MRKLVLLLLLAAGIAAGAWWYLGRDRIDPDAPLAFVPAETPYVFASTAPPPEAVVAQWQAQMEAMGEAYRGQLDDTHALISASPDADPRLLAVLVVLRQELAGKPMAEAVDTTSRVEDQGRRPQSFQGHGVRLIPHRRLRAPVDLVAGLSTGRRLGEQRAEEARPHKRHVRLLETRRQGQWRPIEVLVNNAGLSRGLDKLPHGLVSDWEEMIDTNVKGLLYVTRAVLPGMIERGRGHIVNIGSIAGHEVYPAGNVYCASKFAVRALTKGLRLDLNGTPIRVSEVAPGMVETEFSLVRFHGDAERAGKVYQGLTPLGPDDVADAVVWCATRPLHVNVSEVVVMPTAQASTFLVHRK